MVFVCNHLDSTKCTCVRGVFARLCGAVKSVEGIQLREFTLFSRSSSGERGSKRLRSYNSVPQDLSPRADVVQDVSFDSYDGFASTDTVRVEPYEHLVVMVHGLYGAPENWDVIKEKVRRRLDSRNVLFYASGVNRSTNSLAGIDTCGERLGEELRIVLRRHPKLKRISFMVHSMGGLVARYFCGTNFDPKTGTINGLVPYHFFAIASPHLGCHVDGDSQVPMIGWGKKVPVLGGTVLKTVFDVATTPFMGILYRTTGRQLFLADGDTHSEPLILKLVQDSPQDNSYFFSALAQFKTRTCYANTNGDAMVGWANASLRKLEDLPRNRHKKFKGNGILGEDPLHYGLSETGTPNASTSEGDEMDSGSSEGKDMGAENVDGMAVVHASEATTMYSCSSFGSVKEVLDMSDRQALVDYMLSRLSALPWCRVDVSFKHRVVPFLAHTHIQVTRKWMDFAGLSVAEHIAQRFSDLEDLVEA